MGAYGVAVRDRGCDKIGVLNAGFQTTRLPRLDMLLP